MNEANLPPRVLLIEDSRLSGRMLRTAILGRTRMPVDLAQSYAEARQLLARHAKEYRVAVVDLVLPDASEGEAVDLAIAEGIAAIVLTGNMNEALRDRIVAKPIVDYVLKQTVSAVEYVVNLVRRVAANQDIKVLVVDDSDSFRNYLGRLLTVHRLQVLQADSAEMAQEIMAAHPDVRMVLADYEMPGMNGVQLTAALRARHSRASTCIIGVTGSDSPYIGAEFLKAGADDILRKPFIVEEFYVRIINHLDTLDHIRLMELHANRDYLTNLYNRRYLFESGAALLARAERENQRLLVAVADIDHFKAINDAYGHETGDRALIEVAQCLQREVTEPALVARLGGEEFCVLTLSDEDPAFLFERIRQAVETLQIAIGDDQVLRLTISIGATARTAAKIGAMIGEADTALYAAKSGGRNRVVVSG